MTREYNSLEFLGALIAYTDHLPQEEAADWSGDDDAPQESTPDCRLTVGMLAHSGRDSALVKIGETVWQDLETPRQLSEDERRLVRQLAGAVDEPVLHRQVERARVVAVCRCGCSSVRLHSDEPAVPATRVRQLSENRRADYFQVAANGGAAEVVLHVLQGSVGELEVFAGEGVAVSLSDVTGLTDITVT